MSVPPSECYRPYLSGSHLTGSSSCPNSFLILSTSNASCILMIWPMPDLEYSEAAGVDVVTAKWSAWLGRSLVWGCRGGVEGLGLTDSGDVSARG